MEREVCPFCGQMIGDKLKHYVLDHEITSLDDFIERFDQVKMEKEKRKAFRNCRFLIFVQKSYFL